MLSDGGYWARLVARMLPVAFSDDVGLARRKDVVRLQFLMCRAVEGRRIRFVRMGMDVASSLFRSHNEEVERRCRALGAGHSVIRQ